MTRENDVYEQALCEHLQVIVRRLREIPADRWEFAPAPSAPCARVIGEHAWSWLVCDRQHILEPDSSRHPRVPDPPQGQGALSRALEDEMDAWRRMLRSLTPEQLGAPRRQFGSMAVPVRWFIYHMLQHVIYKSGQLSELYFALGLDGDAPYTAPWPNAGYEAEAAARRSPLLRAIFDGDLAGVEAAATAGASVEEPDAEGDRPLLHAARLGSLDMVDLLLRLGADPRGVDATGHTAGQWAEYLGFAEIGARLRAAEIG